MRVSASLLAYALAGLVAAQPASAAPKKQGGLKNLLMKPVRGARNLVDKVTGRKVAVHLANFSSRSTLTLMSFHQNGAGIATGTADGLIATAGLIRQLKEKPLKEVMKDPVTETLVSIGLTGVGNALRMAGLPHVAELSFGGAAVLGGHGLKSAVEAASSEIRGGKPKLTFKQTMIFTAKNPFQAGANLMRVLRDSRVGLAGSNAFMKLSLMAATANQHELSAAFASIGVTLGLIPVASQVSLKSPGEFVASLKAIAQNPMNITTGALVLTDFGLGAGQLGYEHVSQAALTGALVSSGISASKALKDAYATNDRYEQNESPGFEPVK